MISFPTQYAKIIERIDQIDPVRYSKSRNYLDGAVSYLSPYISRGVISTKQVMEHVLTLGLKYYQVEKFIQELAWRDYWQQVWINKGDLINQDLKHPQPHVVHHEMPASILKGDTGIKAIDKAIEELNRIGYMHNHVRMYVAAMACNIAHSHWLTPARWMYYHLLDGDWASNALSWQWVAGANSNKCYLANQENINRYCHTDQTGTFLDKSYEALGASSSCPEVLQATTLPKLETQLPTTIPLTLDPEIPSVIYTSYNLDPNWKSDIAANRILHLDPIHFKQYPVSSHVISFIIQLAKDNIPGIQLFTGSFDELKRQLLGSQVYFKEHPTTRHYEGVEEERDWMFSVKGYYPSFFSYYKKCKKELAHLKT
ncbi:FAD-binding domain-containing protein [Reichenbachiella ulvae]|uniref:Deoxyribodipyrimidine photolyase n=1 Tax=Reichenbachiella ulvae TaxID=2980104 RepID=A0ABT3CZA0_9BACT|nr:FAD-binding domain-containing protein [Reichenbachiella ulvae]MCV9388957.1 deoxyribodipyrimidine photolyase [Reichenbachiella ulvae]